MTIDLSTNYLGLRLAHPIVVAACPLTANIDSLKRLEQAGAAAAVLPSIFEEQIEHDELELVRMFDLWALSSPESAGYFPELDHYNTGPDAYLSLIAQAKQQCSMPIIASLNGSTLSGWLRYAGLIEQAGADALEVNVYHVPTASSDDSNTVDRRYSQIVGLLKENLQIPIAVKLGPYFSSLPHLAKKLAEAGADGLVLFNRFLAPDIDLESLQFVPALELSAPHELRLSLRWISILRDQLSLSLAANGGVHCADDVVKSLLVGADVVACASVLLKQGPAVIGTLREGLANWIEQHQYDSLQQLQGSLSMHNCANPEGLKRANYMRALVSYTPTSLVTMPERPAALTETPNTYE